MKENEDNRKESRINGKKRAGQLRFEKILSRGLYVFSTNEREKNRTLSLAREELYTYVHLVSVPCARSSRSLNHRRLLRLNQIDASFRKKKLLSSSSHTLLLLLSADTISFDNVHLEESTGYIIALALRFIFF